MKTSRKKTTIKDVALRAGVSATTVAMVLNGKDASLPQSTRERVRRAAAELDYRTDFLARAMVTGRTNIVGMIIPDISNPFFAEAVRHIQVELAGKGYDLILCNSEERVDNDVRYLRLLAGRNVDGLIFTPSAEAFLPKNAEKLRSLLAEIGIPFLFFDRYFEGVGPHVAVDNEQSSFLAVRELLEKGHRRIGVITGPRMLNSSANRLKGVRRAFSAYGLTLSDDCIYDGKYDIMTGVSGAAALLKRDVTAIFAFSDMQAYGVYETLRRAGKRIPDEISVMGFDDNLYSSVLEVPLSTMRQPVESIAKEACRVLLEHIAGSSSEPPVCFAAELVRRASVGAPRH